MVARERIGSMSETLRFVTAETSLMVGTPPPRRGAARFFEAGATVVLREDDVHRLLEHRARRTGLGGQPEGELMRMDLEQRGEVLAAALEGFTLLEDAGAHFSPSRLLFHRVQGSKACARSGL